MDKERDFILDKLQEIINLAKKQNLTVDEIDVKSNFSEINLNENQISLIENYLASQNVNILNKKSKNLDLDVSILNELEEKILKYLNTENSYKKPILDEILNSLILFLDNWLLEVYFEDNLKDDVYEEAVLALSEYILTNKFIENISANDENIKEVVLEIVNTAHKEVILYVNRFLDEFANEVRATNTVLDKVNFVNDGAILYKSEFSIKPTPKELANYLNISEEEVIDAVIMSGYQIEDIDFDNPK